MNLNEDHHPTAGYVREFADPAEAGFSGYGIRFGAADIVSQILNFGLPAPSISRSWGRRRPSIRRYEIVDGNRTEGAAIPGGVMSASTREVHGPDLRLDVNRTQAEQAGLQQQNVASAVLISLAPAARPLPTSG